MELASHNTMTYMKATSFNWLHKIVSRCQSKDIDEQIEAGVRHFDLRVRFKNGRWIFAHGLANYNPEKYNTSLLDILIKLDSLKDKVVVTFVLETLHPDVMMEERFKTLCKLVEELFPNIQFISGYAKYDWSNQLYKFKSRGFDVSTESKFRSVSKPTIFPYLWAKLNNKKYLKEGTDKRFLMIDFV